MRTTINTKELGHCNCSTLHRNLPQVILKKLNWLTTTLLIWEVYWLKTSILIMKTTLQFLSTGVTPTIINPLSDKVKLASSLCKIKPGKAAGPDEIHSKELVAAEGSLINGLDIVFRKSFESIRFPTKWKLPRVSAIFKKVNLLDPANYCLLSMLSLPGKLLESQFCSILDNHLQMYNIYSENRWEFSEGR